MKERDEHNRVISQEQLESLTQVGVGLYVGVIDEYRGLYEINPETREILSVQAGQQTRLPIDDFHKLLATHFLLRKEDDERKRGK